MKKLLSCSLGEASTSKFNTENKAPESAALVVTPKALEATCEDEKLKDVWSTELQDSCRLESCKAEADHW